MPIKTPESITEKEGKTPEAILQQLKENYLKIEYDVVGLQKQFAQNADLMRRTFEQIQSEINSLKIFFAEQITGKDLIERLKSLETDMREIQQFKETIVSNITLIKWILTLGFTFISSLIIALISLLIRLK